MEVEGEVDGEWVSLLFASSRGRLEGEWKVEDIYNLLIIEEKEK